MGSSDDRYWQCNTRIFFMVFVFRRSFIWNFMLNILGALAAYALQPKKPSLNLAVNERKLMVAMAA